MENKQSHICMIVMELGVCILCYLEGLDKVFINSQNTDETL